MDGSSENFVVHAPYRLSPLGAHTDHQGGLTSGLTLQQGIDLHAHGCAEPRVELRSRGFEGTAAFQISDAPGISASRSEGGDEFSWIAYAAAATAVLSEQHALPLGMSGGLTADLPSGGISSSAALTVAIMLGLAHVNGLRLNRLQLAKWCREAEQRATGVQIGLLDPAVILHGKERALVVVDTKAEAIRVHGFNRILGAMHWLLLDCGEQRSLMKSPYNERVHECFLAAKLLRREAGLEEPADESNDGLSSVPPEVFRRHRAKLPETLQRRADHYYSETRRVKQGLSALSAGDLRSFGRLITASGESLARAFDCGTPKTRQALDALLAQDGVLGASFAGAGFGGHVQALLKDGTCAEETLAGLRAVLAGGQEENLQFSAHLVRPGRRASVTQRESVG